jgi:rhodanese-related sulfurtransferase
MRTINHVEVHRMLENGAQIVDVLPSHAFRKSHIKGAIHIPLAKILHDAARQLERERPVIVYCRDSL